MFDMEKSFRLLTLNTPTLKNIFISQAFSDFSVCFAQNSEELIDKLESSQLPDAIIIDEESAINNQNLLITKIQDQIILRNALNDSISITNPIIVIQNDAEDFETQLKLYEIGAMETYPKDMNINRLAAKIRHLSGRFQLEQRRILCSSAQQRNTIRSLVQLNRKSGVYNKQTFLNKTQELIKNNPDKRYSILLMNLDRFKVFNDLFGFDEGDKILEKIGDYLNHRVKGLSTYGHIYADHFVICTETENLNIEAICKETKEFFNNIHPNFDFIARYGIYQLKDSEEDVSLGCDRAELALNTIKQDFTERLAFYNESMIQNLKEEQELITDMVSGIKNKEFKVFFQPQFDYTTESLIGAEALVRWQHPTKGLISPALFIPVFERNGFITQLDEYIWNETCKLQRKWIDMELNPVPVSVNISRRDIYNHDLVKIFDSLLKKYDLTPNNLRLEITESAYMDNPSQLIQVVSALRGRGFCLEMDDFGSGYSSLNTLKEVPVDILKLDMKFIESGTTKSTDLDGNEDTRGGNILSSVVRMANWLHLPVIAEGIESKEQADYLKSIGCFHMQGFYFAKPMPEDEYEKMISELRPVLINNPNSYSTSEASKFLDATTQSTLLFNSFVGGAAIVEWIGDNLEVLRMNDQFFEELGTTQENYAAYQKNFIDTIDENSRTVFLNTLSEVTRMNTPSFCEVMLKPFYKGNQPFWVRVHIRHIGKTITSNIYYISIENIDFRIQLLQLNTNLSEQLSSIMENIPCGIITMNFGKEFKASYSNETAAKILGYTQNEFRSILSENPFDIFQQNEGILARHYIYNAITENKKSFNKKAKILCKDGKIKKVQFAGTILKHTDGTIVINIIFVDINEQENQTIKGYTEVMFSIFSEVFEINFDLNKSRTIRADYIEDYKKLEKPLDEALGNWFEKCVVESDRARVKAFLTAENLNNIKKSGIKVPTIDYNFKSLHGDIRRLRTTIISIPMENNRFLLCNSEIPMAQNNSI